MTRVDDLPADQRATLSLLLRQRKSYAEVAALLGIQEGAVRDRAQAALATLAGGAPIGHGTSELTAARREEIGDYLLGQQASAASRTATRAYLEGSAIAGSWAGALAAELEKLAEGALPEIPRAPPSPQPRRMTLVPSPRRPSQNQDPSFRSSAADRCPAPGSGGRCCWR